MLIWPFGRRFVMHDWSAIFTTSLRNKHKIKTNVQDLQSVRIEDQRVDELFEALQRSALVS